MKPRRALLVWVGAAAIASVSAGSTPVPGPRPERLEQSPGPDAPAPGGHLPVLRVHRYRMAGRIRPLLFWIGRDDVGMGEIVWRGAEGAVAYELLIGTDAARAPRGINRWGYLFEESGASGSRVLGVMTTSDEATLSDVTRRTPGTQPVGRFKGLEAFVAGGRSRSTAETIETERDYGVRDKALIVDRIERRLQDAVPRDVAVPAGVRPGFLTAVAELVNDTIAARKGGDQALRRLKGRTVGYMYGRGRFDLTLTGVGTVRASPGGSPRRALVHAEFGTLNRGTGSRSTFELDYATEGPLAGVPTLIRHQPRWWLQAVLKLEEAGAPRADYHPIPDWDDR